MATLNRVARSSAAVTGVVRHRAAAQRRVNPREEVIDLLACVAAHDDRERAHRRAPLRHHVRGLVCLSEGCHGDGLARYGIRVRSAAGT